MASAGRFNFFKNYFFLKRTELDNLFLKFTRFRGVSDAKEKGHFN